MPGWSDRVRFGGTPGSEFAYRPHQFITSGVAAREFAILLLRGRDMRYDEVPGGVRPAPEADGDGFTFFDLEDFDGVGRAVNVLELIADIRDGGFKAQPNHVMFPHTMSGNPLYGNPLYGNPLYGNPLYGNPLYGNPLYGNPLYGNPLYGNPLYGNPLYGNPLYGNPLYGNAPGGSIAAYDYTRTGRRANTAIPTEDPGYETPPIPAPVVGATVVILDTGLAGRLTAGGPDELPEPLRRFEKPAGGTGIDAPAAAGKSLRPIAGHGTFIAGLVHLIAPGTVLDIQKVLQEEEGDVDEKVLSDTLSTLAKAAKTILNLSFGGYADDDDFFLRRKIRNVVKKGIVVVASAGNDGIGRPSIPASFPDVIGVGALSSGGPAPFSNFGPWVRACAPGVDLVSMFFAKFDGPIEIGVPDEDDPDRFTGWARWSGTSFSAPLVCAALAREIALTGCTAKQAVKRVIDAPSLFRLPWLGTVVNPPWPEAANGPQLPTLPTPGVSYVTGYR